MSGTVKSLRLSGTLLVLGLLGLVLWIASAIRVFHSTDTAWIEELSVLLGYCLAGFAGWWWIVRSRQTQGLESAARGPSRWMAAASLVTAAGIAAETYQRHQIHATEVAHGLTSSPYYRSLLAGGFAGTLGFLLAGVGFWIASYVQSPQPSPSETESDEGKTLTG